MKFIVYKYTSPKKKSYIGITCDEVRRKNDHKQKEHEFHDTTPFARAIRKYGIESFEYEVLERFDTAAEMMEREIYWIKFYDSIDAGYNLLEGGQWGRVTTHCERTIQDTIHLLKNTEHTIYKIAELTGVSVTLVSDIKNGNKRNPTKIERSHKSRKGSTNGSAKLTEELAKEIKGKLKSGTSRKIIKTEYNISKSLVQQLATGEIWGHVESEYEYKPLEVNGNAKLTAEIVREIKLDQAAGMSLRDTVEKYEISRSTVQQIRYEKTWKDVKI